MTSNELLERIHRIGQIECSDPDCSACAEHRKDALLEIEKYRESVLCGATRAFIDQPSSFHQLHHFHGTDVIVPYQEDSTVVTVYPISGSTISMRIPKLCLTSGWPKHARRKPR